jgi:5-methylcytosine-specific restriction protein A
VTQQPRLRTLRSRLAIVDVRVARPAPKVAAAYYSTPEHRAWAKLVVQRASGRCQDPACKAPQQTGRRLFADHVVELRDGGSPIDPANGMARCGSCHSRKTAAERARRMACPT